MNEEALKAAWELLFKEHATLKERFEEQNKNLTATQVRCTELLLSNRELKKHIQLLEERWKAMLTGELALEPCPSPASSND